MPHESTVAHEQRFVADSPMFSRSRQTSVMDGKEVEPTVSTGKTKARLIDYLYKSFLIVLVFKGCFYISVLLFFEKVLERSQSLLPHVRPETPRKVTHFHDEDDSEEESEKSA